MHPLDGVRLKIKIANYERKQLESYLLSFLADIKANRIVVERDPETSEYVAIYRGRIPDRLHCGVQIGIIAHLLRSALDNLTWQLALLNCKKSAPHPSTQFPIFLKRGRTKDESSFRSRAFRRTPKGGSVGYLQSVGAKHRAMIEGTQPYMRSSGRRLANDPLWWLHEINRFDKHRVVQIVVQKMTGISISFDELVLESSDARKQHALNMIRRFQEPLEDGTEIARSNTPMEVDPQQSFTICFSKSCPSVSHLKVIQALRAIEERVIRIVHLFESEFS